MSDYVPLSRRLEGVEVMPLTDDVPNGAFNRLCEFLLAQLHVQVGFDFYESPEYGYLNTVMRQIESALDLHLTANLGERLFSDLEARARSSSGLMIHILDALLHFKPVDPKAHEHLNQIFAEAYMNWRVIQVGDGYQLAKRVSDESQAALDGLAAGSSAASHMREAWAALYGKQSNPQHAYAEAVFAIEAAARPIIAPNDKQATLGRMLGSIQSENPAKLTSTASLATSAGDTDAQLAALAMKLLWQTQRRHGSEDPTVDYPATTKEAEMAVHLALWLVHSFQSGLLHT